MRPLAPGDFHAFFRETNDGNPPFPWQERLARQVFESGRWPSLLDLPTGSGKTAVLEIALFHLALEAGRGAERRAPVRIAFVVDRRLIVDQAHCRALAIARSLDPGGEGVVGQVARALGKLAEEEKQPLVVRALRGGLPREADWARTPAQPTVLVSTVDQVGSRLLFRGYGISKSMRPIHAGLLGSDCLIFLDEAHLSEPFRQTLDWVEHYQGCNRVAPWSVVSMSATPSRDESQEQAYKFGLNSQRDLANDDLNRRLLASKPAELRGPAEFEAKDYADVARELLRAEGIRRVLIVVNRVSLARSVFEQFSDEQNPLLLTGRVRELDRERILARLESAMSGETKGPLLVVATQCVEAGADLDFDALVTQIAPLDALRQRFGRLNRKGRGIPARAFILASRSDLGKKPDPIYGDAGREAWNLLHQISHKEGKRALVDFGSLRLGDALNSRTSEEISRACTRKLDAPVLPPAYLDLWACTNPPPSVEPDVPLFLHGPERASADVEVVWRADITASDFGREDWLIRLIAAAPPRSGETLAAPVWAVRQWLAESPSADRVSDLEGDKEPEDLGPGKQRMVLRWRGMEDEQTQAISGEDIRAGDVIVVPTGYGGCDKWGWTGRPAGARLEPMENDLAKEAAERLKTRDVTIRLHFSLFSAAHWDEIRRVLEDFGDDPETILERLDLERLKLEDLIAPQIALAYDDDDRTAGLVLIGRRPAGVAGDPSSESDTTGSFASREVTLAEHTSEVVEKAREFGERAGLSDRILRSLVFAARHHDSGKGDGRFQAYISGRWPGNRILAKSKQRLNGGAEKRRRAAASLPDRWRHEALSVRLATLDAEIAGADSDAGIDKELALWLIGTHHGWGRPFFPHEDNLDDCARSVASETGPIHLHAASGPQRLDFSFNGYDWTGIFDCLQRRYGAWELARLEAILRLADHRASEDVDEQNTYAARNRA